MYILYLICSKVELKTPFSSILRNGTEVPRGAPVDSLRLNAKLYSAATAAALVRRSLKCEICFVFFWHLCCVQEEGPF